MVRSGDLVSYTAEEGVRVLGEGKLLLSDSFPGNERNKYCLASKVYIFYLFLILFSFMLPSFCGLGKSSYIKKNSAKTQQTET